MFLSASSQCNNTGQTLATCNFTGSSVNLTCQYHIPSKANVNPFTIQWHFAKDCQEIGVKNSNTIISHKCVKNESAVPDPKYKCNTFSENGSVRNSNLTIFKLNATNDTTNGYYWCSVQNFISNQVIHIQTRSINTSTCNSSINVTILSNVSPVSTSCCAEDKNCTYGTISLVKAQNRTCRTRNHSATCTTPTAENTTSTATTSSGRSLPTDPESVLEIVWVSIGVVLALLLLGVVILLTIIAALRCRKREVKGEPAYIIIDK